jgi:hypothetical protein
MLRSFMIGHQYPGRKKPGAQNQLRAPKGPLRTRI